MACVRLRRLMSPAFAILAVAVVVAGLVGACSSQAPRAGHLEFTLDRVQRDWVDPEHTRAPKGTWVLTPVTVKNVGDGPATFRAEDQKLKEPGGQTLSPDTDTMDVEFPGHSSVTVEPGSQSLVYLLFDVPFGVLPNKIELHESAQSPGETLDLP
jgi:hypothetical protein